MNVWRIDVCFHQVGYVSWLIGEWHSDLICKADVFMLFSWYLSWLCVSICTRIHVHVSIYVSGRVYIYPSCARIHACILIIITWLECSCRWLWNPKDSTVHLTTLSTLHDMTVNECSDYIIAFAINDVNDFYSWGIRQKARASAFERFFDETKPNSTYDSNANDPV